MKNKLVNSGDLNIFNNFKKYGHRLTAPRKAIIKILSNTNNHPSVEEIYMDVHKKYPSIGITTVYRTLDLLVNWGLVHKFDFGEGKSRYELIEHPNGLGHHHHLICVNCKRIINYTDLISDEIELFKKLENRLSDKYNFKINNHIIEFYGICNECSTN